MALSAFNFNSFERDSYAIQQGGADTVKVNLSLKDSHIMIIESLKEKHSIASSEEIVCRYVTSALRHGDLESIFGTPREQCGAGCLTPSQDSRSMLKMLTTRVWAGYTKITPFNHM